MRERIRILLVIYGLLLTATVRGAVRPTRPKFKIATTSTTSTTTTTEEPEPEEPEVTTVQIDVNATTGHTLTGIPQIDYIWDPNLPRELNGFNLSSYPFYSTVPEEINFKCDGLHDGFYASIEHKCQVYHHCLFGTRYDFLCANFTAFDQKTFICHFASEVDCANSKKYWHRNDALYQATTTTTTSTTTTTTLPPPTSAAPLIPVRPALRDRDLNRRRRPFRRRPAYDYYDDEYYDEEYDRTRPRGYDRRDSYEYDDRNYKTDRDRDRDRDYRDPDRDRSIRHRERDNPRPIYNDRDQREREKIPANRSNRREPTLRVRPVDQYDEDSSRPLPRDRVRDTAEGNGYPDGKSTLDDRRKDSTDYRARDSPRDMDDRRYSDKRYRNDYEDKLDPVPIVTGGTDSLVKPAAPSTSVYARPRAPPKIRRPVPVSEQDKYSYNVSSVAASATPNDEPRRRPDPIDDDYLEDDLEEIRPRRPVRRRPAYRDKEVYDARENRDRERDRDRYYRTRYQDKDEEEVRMRKRPDRQRDRIYERGERPYGYDRDRSLLDRGVVNPTVTERPIGQYSIRSERPIGSVNTRGGNRDDDLFVRPKFSPRERESAVVQSEPMKKTNSYYQRTEKKIENDEVGDDEVGDESEEENDKLSETIKSKDSRERNAAERFSDQDSESKLTPEQSNLRSSAGSRGNYKYEETSSRNPSAIDYTSDTSSDYYDEPDDIPVSSPRSTLRIVKRPFLPSRGGNPNPRGLKQVGLRVEPRSEEDRSSVRQVSFKPVQDQQISREFSTGGSGRPTSTTNRENGDEDEISERSGERDYSIRRQPYDAYKTIQSDVRQHQGDESNDEDVAPRPQTRRLQKEDSDNDRKDFQSFDDARSSNVRTSSDAGIKNEDNSEPLRRKANEVVNRLQDIPESEYDVTLNDALTPSLNQESNLPSGFILPLHRQLERDANLQSSQRKYLFARPVETVNQPKSPSPISSGSNSFAVPPIIQRSRTTFPRQSSDNIFAPGHPQAPWQGYVEY